MYGDLMKPEQLASELLISRARTANPEFVLNASVYASTTGVKINAVGRCVASSAPYARASMTTAP